MNAGRSNGDPIPAGGLTFDAGAGKDRLVVVGDGTQNPNYSPDGTTNGTGTVGLTIGMINFTSLEASAEECRIRQRAESRSRRTVECCPGPIG